MDKAAAPTSEAAVNSPVLKLPMDNMKNPDIQIFELMESNFFFITANKFYIIYVRIFYQVCSNEINRVLVYIDVLLCSRFIAQYMAGYATAYPAGKIIPKPNQKRGSVGVVCMKPGIINAKEFSIVSIAAILAVSPTTVTFAACLSGIVLSIGIIVNK